MSKNNDYIELKLPELSEWRCELFGSHDNGITWRPPKGQHPNAWWRFWQWAIFGNRWIKDPTRP